MKPNNLDKQPIGCLWTSKSKTGMEYWRGEISINDELHKIVVFGNRYKNKTKHPDYRIFLANEPCFEENKYKKPKDNQQSDCEITPDEIPF